MTDNSLSKYDHRGNSEISTFLELTDFDTRSRRKRTTILIKNRWCQTYFRHGRSKAYILQAKSPIVMWSPLIWNHW